MTEQEKAAVIAEANRLHQIILDASQRRRRSAPKSRAAYHAQELRARRRLTKFDLSLRERGYYLYGGLNRYTVHEMDEQQREEYRRWKDEPDDTD